MQTIDCKTCSQPFTIPGGRGRPREHCLVCRPRAFHIAETMAGHTYRPNAAPDALCEICKQPETAIGPLGNVRALARDHNHATGADRGDLCTRCNTGIGYLREDPVILASAIEYLAKYGD